MKCYILIGGVGSGKSTYAKEKAKDGWIIINDDALVNAVHADQYLLYNKCFKPLYKGIEAAVFSHAVALNVNIVIDRTNLDPETRKRYVCMCRAFDVKDIIAVVFPMVSPEEHALRRFNSDSRGVSLEKWTEIAKYHFSMWKEPSLEEGFSEIIKL